MQIETLPQLDSTGDSRLGLYRLHSEPSYSNPFRPVEHGSDSLAASPEAANLQWMLVTYLQGGWFDGLQSRLLVDTSWVVREVERRSTFQPEPQEKLAAKLNAAFEAEPVEDGMDHPAIEIIEKALLSAEHPHVLEWLQAFCLDPVHPNFSASVLRCLGRRAHPGTMSWQTDLVRSALDMDDAEIRAAAVQAAEFWGGQDMRNVLAAHNEPLHWLRNYVRDVIEDLGG